MGFSRISCGTDTHPEEEAPGPWVLATCLQWQQQNRVGGLHQGPPTRTPAPHGSEVGRVEPRPLVQGWALPFPSLVLALRSLSASQSPSSWVCLRLGCSYFEGKEHLGLLSSLSSVFVGPVAVAVSHKVPRVEPRASLQQ